MHVYVYMHIYISMLLFTRSLPLVHLGALVGCPSSRLPQPASQSSRSCSPVSPGDGHVMWVAPWPVTRPALKSWHVDMNGWVWAEGGPHKETASLWAAVTP